MSRTEPLKALRSTCPVAAALDLMGDRWTLLVLRDLLLGMHYYDELLEAPEGIATNILAERLRRLQEADMVVASSDPDNRRRKRYELTERGQSFAPVLLSLAKWGLEHIDGTKPDPRVVAYFESRKRR